MRANGSGRRRMLGEPRKKIEVRDGDRQQIDGIMPSRAR
jgi:hypothetical protein